MADVLSIDFETKSQADLKRVGAAVYAKHPTTKILCMSWAFNDEPVATWRPGQIFPARIWRHVEQGGIVRGWNVAFEFWIWNERLLTHMLALAGRRYPALKIAQLRDTMAQAAYWGLPMGLGDAAPAAGVQVLKDKAGHALMLQMCRPRQIKKDGTVVWWDETDPAKYDRLCDYCEQDVRTERAIADRLPPLPDDEQDTWELDFQINVRGVRVDTYLVSRLEKLVAESRVRLTAQLIQLTNGQVTGLNKVKEFLAWLKFVGYPHDDLKKTTIAERLKDPACRGLERRGLLLRRESAR
ncbi:MAG: hypothetical protein P4M09_11020, partial [Devosia sp.]|nr:hypothetical protein [Devosia sp.]